MPAVDRLSLSEDVPTITMTDPDNGINKINLVFSYLFLCSIFRQ